MTTGLRESSLSEAGFFEPSSITAPVRGAIFTPDGRLVLTDDANGVLRVWNASTGLLVRSARNVSSGPLARQP